MNGAVAEGQSYRLADSYPRRPVEAYWREEEAAAEPALEERSAAVAERAKAEGSAAVERAKAEGSAAAERAKAEGSAAVAVAERGAAPGWGRRFSEAQGGKGAWEAPTGPAQGVSGVHPGSAGALLAQSSACHLWSARYCCAKNTRATW